MRILAQDTPRMNAGSISGSRTISRRRYRWYQYGEPYPRKEDFRRMVDSETEPIKAVERGIPLWVFGGPNDYPSRPPRFILKAGDTFTLSLVGGKVIDEYRGFWLVE